MTHTDEGLAGEIEDGSPTRLPPPDVVGWHGYTRALFAARADHHGYPDSHPASWT